MKKNNVTPNAPGTKLPRPMWAMNTRRIAHARNPSNGRRYSKLGVKSKTLRRFATLADCDWTDSSMVEIASNCADVQVRDPYVASPTTQREWLGFFQYRSHAVREQGL